jgi:uncharacterized protein YndB with AHSA1/START domain
MTKPRFKKETKTLTSSDFTATFTVDRTPEEVFAAINDVRGWWSESTGIQTCCGTFLLYADQAA